MPEVIQSDILVIGGGGAAARAAITAHEAGATVVLAVKGKFGAIGTRGGGATACGITNRFGFFDNRGAPGNPDEEARIIVDDVLTAGLGTAEPYLVDLLVQDRFAARRDLERWGLVLTKSNPKSDIRRETLPMPGMAYVARGTGVQILDHTMVTDLLIQGGVCVGAVGLDEEGKTYIFKAATTIVATGGNARLYMFNCHPNCVTGDGYAMGYAAGAELMNMEFMQIFLATTFPNTNLVGSNFLQQHPKFTNAQGREFVQDYLPSGCDLKKATDQRALHNPYSTRDKCSRYIDVGMTKETVAGRAAEHKGLYVHMPRPEALPLDTREWLEFRGVDVGRPMEVNTVHQCSNGGFRIKGHGETTIPGLYGVGEAATGYHGADRLGGHMMACSQVFGRRAGLHASAAAKKAGAPAVKDDVAKAALERIENMRKSKGNQKPADVTRRLAQIAWEDLLAVRSEASIKRVLKEVERIRAEDMPKLGIETASDLTQALELQNLVLNAELVGKAALMRTESRGGHYREDFPETDQQNWAKAILVKQVNGKMQLTTEVVDPQGKDRQVDMGDRIWG